MDAERLRPECLRRYKRQNIPETLRDIAKVQKYWGDLRRELTTAYLYDGGMEVLFDE